MPDGSILETASARLAPAGRAYRPATASPTRATIRLPQLPYPASALTPVLSEATVAFHHGRHHKGHIDVLNDAIRGTRYELMPLARIVVEARRDGAARVRSHASHAFSHEMYWRSMTPGGSPPRGRFAEAVERDFGSVDHLRSRLADAALSDPGNGFVWLVAQQGRLAVVRTSEDASPLGKLGTPLFALDAFAHAYLIDYRDCRERYVNAVLHELADWGGASDRYAEAA